MMRTTVTIPDDLASAAQELSQGRPLSELIRRALRELIARLEREKLARELEEGYRSEAEELSLDAEWSEIETEGW